MTATIKAKTIANATDASLCNAAAQHVKVGEASTLRGMATAAVFLSQRGDTKANRATLFLAFAKVTSESSASNYVSKAGSCAMPVHVAQYGHKVDVNAALDVTVDAIMPGFVRYWHAIRDIKNDGPKAVVAATGAAAKTRTKATVATPAVTEAAVPTPPVVVPDAPSETVEALLARLMIMANGMDTMDVIALHAAMNEKFDTLLAGRADELENEAAVA